MSEHYVVPKGPVPVCDFCSQTPVRWTYPARDFSHRDSLAGVSFQFNSSNEWAACDPCHRLIERGDRDGLAKRSVEIYREKHPLAMPLTIRVARGVQDGFWAHREGAPSAEPT